jgi:uncharacterized protein (TIGR03083 family)
MPADKAELLWRIAHEWAALERVVGSLSEEQMSVPDAGGWSVKDNLAHLTSWEEFARLHYLQDRPSHEALGLDEETFGDGDEDELNEILFQRNRGLPVSEVLEALRSTHANLLLELERTPPEALKQQYYADDPEARPRIYFMVYNTYEHYAEHRMTIGRIVEQNSV